MLGLMLGGRKDPRAPFDCRTSPSSAIVVVLVAVTWWRVTDVRGLTAA